MNIEWTKLNTTLLEFEYYGEYLNDDGWEEVKKDLEEAGCILYND